MQREGVAASATWYHIDTAFIGMYEFKCAKLSQGIGSEGDPLIFPLF